MRRGCLMTVPNVAKSVRSCINKRRVQVSGLKCQMVTTRVTILPFARPLPIALPLSFARAFGGAVACAQHEASEIGHCAAHCVTMRRPSEPTAFIISGRAGAKSQFGVCSGTGAASRLAVAHLDCGSTSAADLVRPVDVLP